MQQYIQIQTEEEILSMGKHGKGIILQTGYAIWKELTGAVKKHKNIMSHYDELMELFNGEPQYGTRKILVTMKKYFPSAISNAVKIEVKQWR